MRTFTREELMASNAELLNDLRERRERDPIAYDAIVNKEAPLIVHKTRYDDIIPLTDTHVSSEDGYEQPPFITICVAEDRGLA